MDCRRLRSVSPNIRVEEIPTGVDTDHFCPRGNEEVPHHLLFAGGLNSDPERDAMIRFAEEIWPRLKAIVPDLSMDLMGENPPDNLLALSKRDASFRVRGLIDDLRPHLERASVCICPVSGEGARAAVLEAFAMAKPMVSNPAACNNITAQEGRHILFARNPGEWISQISSLLADDGLRRDLGRAARELALTQYDYHVIGMRLQRLYDDLAPAAQ